MGYYSLAINLFVLVATALGLLLGSGVPLPKISRSLRSRLCALLLALLCLVEGALSIYSGVEEGQTLEKAIGHATKGQQLYEAVAATDPELFYRADFSYDGTSNDGAIHHYNGVDVFSSSALVNHGNFASALGLRAWPDSNSTVYIESTPFTNTLCGIKYLLAKKDGFFDETSMSLVARLDDYELRAVPSYIGIGFMTDSKLSSFASLNANKNPFDEQSELFRLATGLEGDLYRYIYNPQLEASDGCSLTSTDNNSQFLYKIPEEVEKGTFTLRYTMEEAGLLSIATRMGGGKKVEIYLNGELVIDSTVLARGIMSLGRVIPGDVVELTYTSDIYKEAGISLFVAMQNDALLQQGLEILSDEVWNITYADDTTLHGTITALEDGLFYSSVPYEPGWTVTVDGVDVPIATSYNPLNPDVKLTDALISFPLSAGNHEISMTYHTPGLPAGMIISLSAVSLYVILILCKKKTLFPILIPTEKENSNE